MNGKAGVLGQKVELLLYDAGLTPPRLLVSTRNSSRRTGRSGSRSVQLVRQRGCGRREGEVQDRLARGAGARERTVPDAAVESTTMSNVRKVLTGALLAALAWAVAPVAEAQRPIRIGATVAQTGGVATVGQSQLRGYQLCVKHLNDKGGVLGRQLELVVYGATRS